MRELVILMLVAVALAWCADHVTIRPLNKQKAQAIPVFIAIFILLAGFAGLRKWYNDTETYRYAYEAMNCFPAYWKTVKFDLGSNFGFGIINAWLKTGGVTSQNFLMFWALIVVGLHLFFLHKYSANYALTVFLLFTTVPFYLCVQLLNKLQLQPPPIGRSFLHKKTICCICSACFSSINDSSVCIDVSIRAIFYLQALDEKNVFLYHNIRCLGLSSPTADGHNYQHHNDDRRRIYGRRIQWGRH